jgi:hypothetical protein
MTLEDGEAVYRQIHDPLVRGETVELDFEGIEVFASPFFNAGIGRLLADLPPDVLNAHLKFEHLSALGDRILRRVIENAKEILRGQPRPPSGHRPYRPGNRSGDVMPLVVRAQVVDIRSDAPTSADRFFVDTNAWYWLVVCHC